MLQDCCVKCISLEWNNVEKKIFFWSKLFFFFNCYSWDFPFQVVNDYANNSFAKYLHAPSQHIFTEKNNLELFANFRFFFLFYKWMRQITFRTFIVKWQKGKYVILHYWDMKAYEWYSVNQKHTSPPHMSLKAHNIFKNNQIKAILLFLALRTISLKITELKQFIIFSLWRYTNLLSTNAI